MTKETKTLEAPNYILDQQIGFALRLASQRHTGIFQNKIIEKLTPTQFSALIKISEVGTCSQNHLGRLVAMDAATTKGVIDRLHKKGLVTLSPDKNDKRRMLISLDTAALDIMDSLKKTGIEITKETLAPLSPKQQEQLLNLLQKIS